MQSKTDCLIEAIDRLSAALWWNRADPRQINSPQYNETSQPIASGCGLDSKHVRDGSVEVVADL
jgi:hypothetical protein